jgi:hypothetical protein
VSDIATDIAVYTNISPVTQVGEVVAGRRADR